MTFPAHRRSLVLSVIAAMLALCCTVLEAQKVQSSDVSSVEDKVLTLEKHCVATLRTLNVAQSTYWGGDDSRGFARTLKQLGPDGEGILDQRMVTGERLGYRFRLVVPDVGEQTPITHYAIVAVPSKRVSSRQRSYYTDESHVIRFTELDHEPTSSDPPLEAKQDR